MSKKKSKSAVESAILKCGGKVGSKKQKLQTGGEVLIQSFDYNTLSSQDKAAYDALSPEQQNQVRTTFNSQGQSTALGSTQGDTSSLGSAGIIGSLISTVGGILDTVAGEVDPETGQSETEAQAAIQGIANSASGANVATGLEQLGEAEDFEDYALSALNVLSPGAGELVNQQKYEDEYRAAKQKANLRSSYYQKRAETSFQDGGEIEEDQDFSPDKFEEVSASDTLMNYIKSSSYTDPEIQANIESIPEQFLSPIGSDPTTGKTTYAWREKAEELKADVTAVQWDPQTLENTKNIARDYYGISREDFNKGYREDPKNYLSNLIKEGTPVEDNPYGTDARFDVGVNSLGQPTFRYGQLDRRTTQELNEGGKIKGAGTGKSDSIEAELPAGSYIIPVDAPKEATSRLMKYLNYDEADLNYNNGEEVKVSNGEFFIPPQDVQKADDFIKRLGYKNGLDEMAPNAKQKLSERPGYVNGGEIGNYAGTVAGAGQIALGFLEAGLNEEPKSNTEDLLRNLSNEVRLRAEYGMDPYERTEAERAIERTFAGEREIITNMGGGSLDVIMNNSAAAAMRANEAKLSLEVASGKIKENKERYADEITMKAIAAHEKDFQLKYDQYAAKEENIANLIQSGIGNIVGQSQFNKYQDMMGEEKDKTTKQVENIGISLAKDENVLDKAIKNRVSNYKSVTSNPVLDVVSQDTSWYNNEFTKPNENLFSKSI